MRRLAALEQQAQQRKDVKGMSGNSQTPRPMKECIKLAYFCTSAFCSSVGALTSIATVAPPSLCVRVVRIGRGRIICAYERFTGAPCSDRLFRSSSFAELCFAGYSSPCSQGIHWLFSTSQKQRSVCSPGWVPMRPAAARNHFLARPPLCCLPRSKLHRKHSRGNKVHRKNTFKRHNNTHKTSYTPIMMLENE